MQIEVRYDNELRAWRMQRDSDMASANGDADAEDALFVKGHQRLDELKKAWSRELEDRYLERLEGMYESKLWFREQISWAVLHPDATGLGTSVSVPARLIPPPRYSAQNRKGRKRQAYQHFASNHAGPQTEYNDPCHPERLRDMPQRRLQQPQQAQGLESPSQSHSPESSTPPRPGPPSFNPATPLRRESVGQTPQSHASRPPSSSSTSHSTSPVLQRPEPSLPRPASSSEPESYAPLPQTPEISPPATSPLPVMPCSPRSASPGPRSLEPSTPHPVATSGPEHETNAAPSSTSPPRPTCNPEPHPSKRRQHGKGRGHQHSVRNPRRRLQYPEHQGKSSPVPLMELNIDPPARYRTHHLPRPMTTEPSGQHRAPQQSRPCREELGHSCAATPGLYPPAPGCAPTTLWDQGLGPPVYPPPAHPPHGAESLPMYAAPPMYVATPTAPQGFAPHGYLVEFPSPPAWTSTSAWPPGLAYLALRPGEPMIPVRVSPIAPAPMYPYWAPPTTPVPSCTCSASLRQGPPDSRMTSGPVTPPGPMEAAANHPLATSTPVAPTIPTNHTCLKPEASHSPASSSHALQPPVLPPTPATTPVMLTPDLPHSHGGRVQHPVVGSAQPVRRLHTNRGMEPGVAAGKRHWGRDAVHSRVVTRPPNQWSCRRGREACQNPGVNPQWNGNSLARREPGRGVQRVGTYPALYQV